MDDWQLPGHDHSIVVGTCCVENVDYLMPIAASPSAAAFGRVFLLTELLIGLSNKGMPKWRNWQTR